MSSHSELWPRDAIRKEFMLAARKISRGDQVLDVGCGIASFRHAIPHASYVGIDPHFGKNHTEDNIHAQTLGEHLALHAGAYDAVCAFEVLEHLSTPGAMFADMMRAVRPGGLVIWADHICLQPLHAAPPHHLAWWTEHALQALAERAGAMVESIEHVDWGETDSLFYWIERCSPIRCIDIHFRHAWSWHAAALVGFLLGRIANKVWNVPTAVDEGASLLMIARRKL